MGIHDLLSKLLVSPLKSPIVVVLYVIPYMTPLRSLDYRIHGFVSMGSLAPNTLHHCPSFCTWRVRGT